MHIPFSEILKSIPGVIGVRLEAELPYSVVSKVGQIELRNYPPFTLARVRNSGSFEAAGDASFRALAEFIFGENEDGKKTAMTTPVFHDRNEDGWTMSFYIPAEESDLTPKNKEVWVEQMPQKTVAAYRYSGINGPTEMEAAEELLLAEVRLAGLKAVSKVWWAQYDQPFSLPMTKRNEALVRIERLS